MTTTILERLKDLGLELPQVAAPLGPYVPALVSGNLVFTSGQLPVKGGVLVATGRVPETVPLELAQAAARQAALNALAAIASAAGSIEKVKRIVRLNVYVNSSPGFVEQAKVANGASDLLVQVFGEAGRHTRCAIGAAELPVHAPVELDLVVEIQA